MFLGSLFEALKNILNGRVVVVIERFYSAKRRPFPTPGEVGLGLEPFTAKVPKTETLLALKFDNKFMNPMFDCTRR